METYMDFFSNPIISNVIAPLFLLLILQYINNRQQKYGKTTKKFHPYGGTKLHQLINYTTYHDYMTDLSSKYKSFRIYNPFHTEVYTVDPANLEYMLKTNFENYGKGPYIYEMMIELLGDGIFTVDGNKWREQRKVSSHEFSTKVLRDFSSKIFKKNAIKLGNLLSEAADKNKIIDINDLFMKTTTDSIFKVGFGIDLDIMSGTNEEGVRFSRAFDDANNMTIERFIDKSWKIKKFLNIGSEAKLKKHVEVIDKFVYKVIQRKIEQMHKGSEDDEFSLKKEDILSRFVQINDNPKYLRDIILNYVLAGKDPIAISLSWLIYMLCRHPEMQDKVAKEIKEATNVSEEITNVEDFVALVSEAALDKMQYLHAALTETIRLYPALPADPKHCFSDDVLPDGCSVKKGDLVCFLPYAMGRMTFIWGDDALEFKPERWLDENGVFHQASPFKFTAFQAGPRTCLGRDFAYRQMKIVASIVLGCFMFKLSDEKFVPRYRMSINLHIDGQLQVNVFNRLALKNPQT